MHARFAEVGVLFGGSSQQLAKFIRDSNKNIQLTMVDNFDQTSIPARARRHISDLHYTVWSQYGEHNFRRVFDHYARGREHSNPQHDLLELDTFVAAESFVPEYLDFVFLDTQHAPDFVAKEIDAWYPRVHPNGILAGKWAEVIDGVFSPYNSVVTYLNKRFGPMGWFRRETAWYTMKPESQSR